MKQTPLTAEYFDTIVEEAAEILRVGGVVLYPTDTLYGLGADAFSNTAVANVQKIKGREEKKPIHCIVADVEMAAQYGDISPYAKILATQFWPGPLTLVMRKKAQVNTGIARGIETIGIRVPDNEFCLALAHSFGKPYTTTSANITGKETGATVSEILEQFGERAAYVDLAIDGGALPPHTRSTVVDVRDEPCILREGAVSAEDIARALAR